MSLKKWNLIKPDKVNHKYTTLLYKKDIQTTDIRKYLDKFLSYILRIVSKVNLLT